MTNPPDDIGQWPPPPRPAEQAPPLGGQGHAPPSSPGHAPPPPQGGHGPSQPPPDWRGPQPTGPNPGYAPAPQQPAGGKGFFGTLFDFSFDHSITTKLIRIIYAGSVAMITLIAVIMILLARSFADWNGTLAVITLLAAPIFWITWLVTARVFLEFVINQFKISEHLKVIRDRGGLR